MKTIITFFLVILVSNSCFAEWGKSGKQHWNSQDIIEDVVLIEKYIPENNSYKIHGVGVIVDFDTLSENMQIITNRHIVSGSERMQFNFYSYTLTDSLQLFNIIPFELLNPSMVCLYPNSDDSDFAIIEIPRKELSKYYNPLDKVIPISVDSLFYGENVEFYGFPLAGDPSFLNIKYRFPTVRAGAIAYFINEYFSVYGIPLLAGVFLIDGVSEGGNSGGPVYIKRPYVCSSASDKLTVCYDRRLAGIIFKHLPKLKPIGRPDSSGNGIILVDDLYSLENFNLACAIPIDMIRDYYFDNRHRIGIVEEDEKDTTGQ